MATSKFHYNVQMLENPSHVVPSSTSFASSVASMHSNPQPSFRCSILQPCQVFARNSFLIGCGTSAAVAAPIRCTVPDGDGAKRQRCRLPTTRVMMKIDLRRRWSVIAAGSPAEAPSPAQRKSSGHEHVLEFAGPSFNYSRSALDKNPANNSHIILRGIIGAQSDISTGWSSVAQYAAAARVSL